MRRLSMLLVFAAASALLVAACDVPGFSMARTVQLGDNDSGRSVSLNTGDSLVLVLTGNPTTGFGWEVSAISPPVIKQLGDPDYQSDSSLVGSGGKYTYHFQAVAAGQAPLTLIYRRPFEPNVRPAKTYTVTVTVQ